LASVELWTIFEVLNNVLRYKDLIKNISNNVTSIINIAEDIKTNKIPIKSCSLFCIGRCFQDTGMEQKRHNNDGKYRNLLRFADDVVLISQDVAELQVMMEDLKMKSEKIGLTMNLSKTKIMTKI